MSSVRNWFTFKQQPNALCAPGRYFAHRIDGVTTTHWGRSLGGRLPSAGRNSMIITTVTWVQMLKKKHRVPAFTEPTAIQCISPRWIHTSLDSARAVHTCVGESRICNPSQQSYVYSIQRRHSPLQHYICGCVSFPLVKYLRHQLYYLTPWYHYPVMIYNNLLVSYFKRKLEAAGTHHGASPSCFTIFFVMQNIFWFKE